MQLVSDIFFTEITGIHFAILKLILLKKFLVQPVNKGLVPIYSDAKQKKHVFLTKNLFLFFLKHPKKTVFLLLFII